MGFASITLKSDLFRKINDEQDPTLAWSSSCEHGQCGTCSMKVNGKPLLACELLVENAVDYFNTTTFQIEPLTVAPAVRDLVVDITTAYERIDHVKPYIIQLAPPPTTNDEYPIAPQELERYVNATRCINCFCCSSACRRCRSRTTPCTFSPQRTRKPTCETRHGC